MMSLSEAGKVLGCSTSTVRTLTEKKVLPRERVPDKVVPMGFHWGIPMTKEELVAAARGQFKSSPRGTPAPQPPEKLDAKDLWTAEEVAKVAGTTSDAVRQYVVGNGIKQLRVNGRNYVIPKDDAKKVVAYYHAKHAARERVIKDQGHFDLGSIPRGVTGNFTQADRVILQETHRLVLELHKALTK